ncbi:MAG: helix-turn-helix domain-containing protein [Beijerinckiaceae bacterium]|nr:helix-turn-helix domain-containing protein [Beijerinckiaceae bacterium]
MLLREFTECECRTPDEINKQIAIDASGSSLRLGKREAQDGFVFRANAARMRDVSLVWFGSNRQHDITSGSRNEIRQIFQIKGKSRWKWGATDLINDQATSGCLVPPDTISTVHNEAHSEGLSVRFEPQALTSKLSALIGESGIDLKLDYAMRDHDPKMLLLQQAAIQVATDLDDAHQSSFNSAIQDELTQALIIRFLLSHSHNFSHCFRTPEGHLATGQVRRIEDYLFDNWDKPLRIEDVVADLQVSARTIFRTLGKSQGCTPMTFVRNVRLDKARTMLMDADATASVLSIAVSCGFQSFGHFERNYKERYGELPSHTLRRRLKNVDA